MTFYYAGHTVSKTEITTYQPKEIGNSIEVKDNHGRIYTTDNLLEGTGLEQDYVFQECKKNITDSKTPSYSCTYVKKNGVRAGKALVFNTVLLRAQASIARNANIFNDIHFYRHAVERCNQDPENEVLKNQLNHYQAKLRKTLEIDYPNCTAEEMEEKYNKIEKYVTERAAGIRTDMNMQ